LPQSTEKLEALVRDLPDAEGARRFYERVTGEQAQPARLLARDDGLLADVLALAAWSPLLSTTLEQNPEYFQWLARERAASRVKTREELGESLARFHLTHSQLDPQVLLARFRRRELLRVYLHDLRRISTLVEITEELSNLADAVLEHALSIARQELDNRYGTPQRTDERGRARAASFSIVALGKLGSFELNYASDIDLLFLYSDEGTTSGKGTRGETSNREYFGKLAERVAHLVGSPSGEGAAYRVDLRLRPYGRHGALASSLEEAVRYYREKAQAWELQALIRARSAAGDASLYSLFSARVLTRVYRTDETVARALSNVRLAKQKIDRHHAHDAGGFNVKLGRGGIREIEFIAQALQLALGGRDDWLRAPHTLISLGRLAERHLITERERTELFDAYVFLRTLEHRLQMEHGLQTHAVPEDPLRRLLVARRMNFEGARAAENFTSALNTHTQNVRAAYDRVFADVPEEGEREGPDAEKKSEGRTFGAVGGARQLNVETPLDALDIAAHSAANIFAPHLEDFESTTKAGKVEEVAGLIQATARATLNPRRALLLTARVASSFDKASAGIPLTLQSLRALVCGCGVSEVLGEQLAGNPALITALPLEDAAAPPRDYRALLLEAVEAEDSFGAELSALRKTWAGLYVETCALDAADRISLRESNHRQSALAEASLDAGCLIARREMGRRYKRGAAEPALAVLGLGRLGGRGVDYGSDLDVVLIYDDEQPSFIQTLNHGEAYGRLSELLVSALSSLTRDGALYRVDLRLRPDGRNGPTASGSRAFLAYLTERAVAWEWLAYVKLRETAGHRELGRRIEEEARRAIHAAAVELEPELLRTETRRVRERLEQERRRGRGHATSIDIKYGAGGMLDVYFATRYLQLRDNVPDDLDDRSTRATLERLHAAGSLEAKDFTAMSEAYAFLRTLDHNLRLVVGRSSRLPARDNPALRDIAHKMGLASPAELVERLTAGMRDTRAAYDRITRG
jgi:[glutamine synthetase] adenylyltransferase / [glutamine synthetase]-adenylyl-L-tyrosine phosphorylase